MSSAGLAGQPDLEVEQPWIPGLGGQAFHGPLTLPERDRPYFSQGGEQEVSGDVLGAEWSEKWSGEHTRIFTLSPVLTLSRRQGFDWAIF